LRRRISSAVAACAALSAITGQSVQGQTLLFDSMSGVENGLPGAASAYVADGTNDDLFVGGAYNLPAGTTAITGFDLDPQNGTNSNITYLQLNVYVWGTVNTGTISATAPAFSNLLGQYSVDYSFAYPGFPAGYDSPFETGSPGASPGLTLATPLTLPTGDRSIGLTYNFQSSSNGITYSSMTGLTSKIDYGIPPTTGSAAAYGFYLSASGETNGNFIEPPTTFGFTNEIMAARIFGIISPGTLASWSSPSGGNWNTPASWSPATVPTSTSDATFNLSSPNYTVNLPSAEVAQDLYVQNDNVTLNLNTSGSSLAIAGTLGVGMSSSGGPLFKGILSLNHSSGVNSGNISAGAVCVGTNGGTGTLTVCTGINLRVSGQVSVGAGSTLTIKPGGRLFVQSLSIAGSLGAWTGKMDIGTSELDLTGTTLQTVTDQVTQGYNIGGPAWQGSEGITSSAAASNSSHLTAVGVISNDVGGGQLFGSGTPLGLFDGINPGLNDILVKYTYYGDANLDGKVDGSDYSLIDNTYANESFIDGIAFNPISGWYNGDFNYDGIVDGSDYALMDNAFNRQGASLAASVQLTPTAAITDTEVPEPDGGLAALVAVAALLLHARPARSYE